MRPTFKARVRLGVKTPVKRVFVLVLARVAQRKHLHRGIRPVVGQLLDNGITWPTIRAVGERIAITPVRRVEKLARAIVAGSKVGRHKRCFVSVVLVGMVNFKAGEILKFARLDADMLHQSRRWRFVCNSQHKRIKVLWGAFAVNGYAIDCVEHPASKLVRMRKAVNERTKTDTLYNSRYFNALRLDHSKPRIIPCVELRVQPLERARQLARLR